MRKRYALPTWDDANPQKVLVRVRRITGQLEGVMRMIRQGRSAGDILLQLASAQAALGQVGKLVLRSHVETRIQDAIASMAGRPGNGYTS